MLLTSCNKRFLWEEPFPEQHGAGGHGRLAASLLLALKLDSQANGEERGQTSRTFVSQARKKDAKNWEGKVSRLFQLLVVRSNTPLKGLLLVGHIPAAPPAPKGNPICKISFCGRFFAPSVLAAGAEEGVGSPQPQFPPPQHELPFPGFPRGRAAHAAMPREYRLLAGPSSHLSLDAKNVAWPAQCRAAGWCSGGCSAGWGQGGSPTPKSLLNKQKTQNKPQTNKKYKFIVMRVETIQ